MRRFSPPSYFGGLPELAEDILRKALGDIADRIDGLEPAVDPAVETSELIMTPGAPRRITPPSTGARAILPAPDGGNAGQEFSMLVESPVGAVTVSALPGRDAGGQPRDTLINGQTTFTASTEGLVTFVSNGVDRYLTHASGGSGSGSNGNSTDTPGTTVVARTLGYPGPNDNLTLRVNNSILARIAGRLVSLVANENDVLRRVASGALEFGQLVTANLGDSIVTVAKQADVAQHTIRGKFTSGTGALEDKAISSLLGSGLSYDTGTGVISASGGSVAQYEYGDTSHSPILLINGDTGTIDQSGNGKNIVNTTANSHGVADCHTGQRVLSIGVGASMEFSSDASIRNTGDVTVFWMGYLEDEPPSNFQFFACGGDPSSETSANNLLYRIIYVQSANRPRVIRGSWEHGIGVNDDVESDGANGDIGLPQHGEMVQIALVRDGTTGKVFVNGEKVGENTGMTVPSGGTVAQLKLGANGLNSTTVAAHCVFSFQVINSALSDAQVLAEFNRAFSGVRGTKS